VKVDAQDAHSRATRVPAYDVERQVSLRLQAFLESANEVMAELTQPEDPPTNTQQIIAAARKQSERLRSASPCSAHNFVRRVVQRVLVHPDKIEVEVNKSELHAALVGAFGTASQQGSFDIIRLSLEARIKRCGGEMRLVIPPDLHGRALAHPVSSLLKVVARARQWYESVIAGEVWGRRSIAHKTGLDERYASQILECAFLAPDIVGAILDGRQPESLTWKKLTRLVPMNWVEQRKRFGFPPSSVDVN
jgi:hypothetical protein